MKLATKQPLSRVPITDSSGRVTQQTLQTLLFIHRFRHVSARHVQLNLGHSTITTTYNQLNLICTKGYIAKEPKVRDRKQKQAASYYLTKEGLALLKLRYPERSFRRARSLQTDATMGFQQRARFLTLADVYAHFKRHYNGHFEFFSAFDLLGLDYMPDLVPDGYVRTTIPGSEMQHYFIEIYGWGRSTQLQQRRLHCNVCFAESGTWQAITGLANPNWFVVVSSQASRMRFASQCRQLIAQSLVTDTDLPTYTALSFLLDGEVSTIWREI